ncbi:hypothetical protein [Azospirillum doebereinerae]
MTPRGEQSLGSGIGQRNLPDRARVQGLLAAGPSAITLDQMGFAQDAGNDDGRRLDAEGLAIAER